MEIRANGHSWKRPITVYPYAMRYDGLSIYQWDDFQNMGKLGQYQVICPNLELMKMQGLDHTNWIMTCIMDDFGNLVRVSK